MAFSRLLILGCGYTGQRVLQLGRARGFDVTVTVRSEARAAQLRELGARVLVSPELDARAQAAVDRETHVVVAFPPDGATEPRIAPWLAGAHSVAYVSSTGVYGELRGRLDDTTPVPVMPDERSRRLLAAEACYRAVGATILRSPAIYGPDRGLHLRVLRGQHRIPGDGSRTMSRIHVEDLAQLALAAADAPADTFVVGDLAPAPHLEVVRYICEAYGVALPDSEPLESVHASLRADRAVDGSRALAALGVTLRFPTYREGLAPEATGVSAAL